MPFFFQSGSFFSKSLVIKIFLIFNLIFSKKKKKKGSKKTSADVLYDIPESGLILPDSAVSLESLVGISSGFKSQYERLQKNPRANKQAAASMRKLAEGKLKIGDKNVRKLTTLQIILPALKSDQLSSINLIKMYYE